MAVVFVEMCVQIGNLHMSESDLLELQETADLAIRTAVGKNPKFGFRYGHAHDVSVEIETYAGGGDAA